MRVIALLLLAALIAGQSDPSWDHQTITYNANHSPVSVSGTDVTLTPYFSPDHSADTHVAMIQAATSTIDIGIPGFDSWNGCTYGTSCIGCSPNSMRNNESFPLWAALLNAAHNGITIRVLTNNYSTTDCAGMISPLPFFQLNNIQVRYYATTTYIHAKYMMVDGKRVSISSVNWSKTSYMENREAGAVIENSPEAINFFNTIFNLDWNEAIPIVITQTYSSDQMQIITDPSPMPVVVPPIPTIHDGRYITPTPQPSAQASNTKFYTSPDSADATLLADITTAQTNVTILMYQITSPDLCNAVQALAANNIQVTLTVSHRIYDQGDCAAAQQCYQQLSNAGLSFQTSPWYYKFTHAKFWIVDGKRVGWSTGNWSPTDYPTGSSVFPPFGQAGWRNTNRDFTVSSDDPNVVQDFVNVYFGDQPDNDAYTGSSSVYCG